MGRGRVAITASAGILAAGVMALCSYLLLAGGGKNVGASRGLVVRITEASAGHSQGRTLVSIACEIENRTGRAVFLDHGSLQEALRARLRFRFDGSQDEWGIVRRSGSSAHTDWGVPEIPLLKPEERKTITVVTSSVHFELRAEEGTAMAIVDFFAHGEVAHARIIGEAYAEGRTIEVESPSVAVAITAP